MCGALKIVGVPKKKIPIHELLELDIAEGQGAERATAQSGVAAGDVGESDDDVLEVYDHGQSSASDSNVPNEELGLVRRDVCAGSGQLVGRPAQASQVSSGPRPIRETGHGLFRCSKPSCRVVELACGAPSGFFALVRSCQRIFKSSDKWWETALVAIIMNSSDISG